MKFCPHCGGDLSAFAAVAVAPTTQPPRTYDQTKTWKALIEKANACRAQPPAPAVLAFELAKQVTGLMTKDGLRAAIHIAFDRDIVPTGGAVYMAAMSNGQAGPQDLRYFEQRGYLVDDGRVRVANDVPVGPAFGALEYWGGEKQYRRWHLSEPISINASRNGDPFFMDDNMVAFGTSWKDASRAEEALVTLLEQFVSGIKGGGLIAKPLVGEVIPLR